MELAFHKPVSNFSHGRQVASSPYSARSSFRLSVRMRSRFSSDPQPIPTKSGWHHPCAPPRPARVAPLPSLRIGMRVPVTVPNPNPNSNPDSTTRATPSVPCFIALSANILRPGLNSPARASLTARATTIRQAQRFGGTFASTLNAASLPTVLTPDSSRFWPAESYQEGINPPSYDKQFVRG